MIDNEEKSFPPILPSQFVPERPAVAAREENRPQDINVARCIPAPRRDRDKNPGAHESASPYESAILRPQRCGAGATALAGDN